VGGCGGGGVLAPPFFRFAIWASRFAIFLLSFPLVFAPLLLEAPPLLDAPPLRGKGWSKSLTWMLVVAARKWVSKSVFSWPARLRVPLLQASPVNLNASMPARRNCGREAFE